MNFWWRLPLAVATASIMTSVAYIAGVGTAQIGSWSAAGALTLVLASLFGLLFVAFVVPTAIVLRLLKKGPLLSSIVVVLLCVAIDVYLYVVYYRMPLGDNVGSYLYGAAGIGLIGGLGYVATQYATLPSNARRLPLPE